MIYTVEIEQKHGRNKFNVGDKLKLVKVLGNENHPITKEVLIYSHKHKKEFVLSKSGFEWMTGQD